MRSFSSVFIDSNEMKKVKKINKRNVRHDSGVQIRGVERARASLENAFLGARNREIDIFACF